MGMDICFYIFKSREHLKTYSAINIELNKFVQEMNIKYKDKLEKAYNDSIFNDVDMPQVYSDADQKRLDSLMAWADVNEGHEVDFLYGNSYASMIPAYFRKYHLEMLKSWWQTHDMHLEISNEIIDDIIKKTEEVLNCPEKAMDILPVLDVYKVFNEPKDSPEEYRYGAYRVIDGKIYSDEKLSADDDVYIREVEKYNKAFKSVKELLNADSKSILAYYESL